MKKGQMVSPYLKNKGSAVRFCLWPQVKKSYKDNNIYSKFNLGKIII
jgi:hypothetical protein